MVGFLCHCVISKKIITIKHITGIVLLELLCCLSVGEKEYYSAAQVTLR